MNTSWVQYTYQDGEGERQNDQLAALEEIEPEG